MVVVSCINNVANNLGWGALFTYTAEVHPTELRALGCGSANMIKSAAGIFGPYFAGLFAGGVLDPRDDGSAGSSSVIAPDGGAGGRVTTALLVLCALDLCACAAALLLPIETRGLILAENVQETETLSVSPKWRRQRAHERKSSTDREEPLLLGSKEGGANVNRA